MGGELSARIVSGLTWLVNCGTGRYSERTARRLRQTNGFNAIVVVLYGSFAVFYALLDWQALQPLVIAIVAAMPLFVIPPLLHRLNDYAAMVSIAVINGVALVLYAYIVGSAAGLHFFLFAAPAAIVFFGPRHVRIAAVVSVCVLIAFLVVELYFPRYSSIAPVSPAVARGINRVREQHDGAHLRGGVFRHPHDGERGSRIGARVQSIRKPSAEPDAHLDCVATEEPAERDHCRSLRSSDDPVRGHRRIHPSRQPAASPRHHGGDRWQPSASGASEVIVGSDGQARSPLNRR